MSDTQDEDEGDMEWLISEFKSRKRKKHRANTMTTQEINEIIIGGNSSGQQKHQEKDIHDKDNQNKNNIKPAERNTTKNNSSRMKEITNKQYKNLFYINAADSVNRLDMVDIWNEVSPKSSDIILQTKKGFLLKSDAEKHQLLEKLGRILENKKITNYKETKPYSTQTRKDPEPTYCLVIATVEKCIQEDNISAFLNEQNIKHRYCKRITSRATKQPTMLIRVITGCQQSFEKLINNGLFYKNRHYPVYPSIPPKPVPIPCNKCSQFDHITEKCTNPITCEKCKENHHTNKCTTNFSPKCLACGAEDHKAWSFKCPKRPTQPIEGIPNTTIRSLNKKSSEIALEKKADTKIHSPVTIHDLIINTYVTKINKPKHVNREELLQKLRKKFVQLYNIDTTVVFSGNRMYVLMFDLDKPLSISPTEPLHGEQNSHIHVS